MLSNFVNLHLDCNASCVQLRVRRAHHLSVHKLPIWVGIQCLHNCVQDVLDCCQLHLQTPKSDLYWNSLCAVYTVTCSGSTDLYVVVAAIIVLVYSLQPAAVVVCVGHQMHVELPLDSARQLCVMFRGSGRVLISPYLMRAHSEAQGKYKHTGCVFVQT